MLKLLFAHICDTAFISEGSKNINIIGIFENIGATNFPALHPRFSVITAIQGDAGNHSQVLVVVDKQTGQEISRIIGQSNILVPDGKAIFIGNFNMVAFPSKGKYLINILVDNAKIGDIEFNVG